MPLNRTTREGLIVGLIAYVSVAAFYSGFDLLAARGTLYTVDLLGKVVFRGLRDPGILLLPFSPDLTSIFWYNALHLFLSLVIGLIVTGLVWRADRSPAQAPLAGLIIVLGFLVTILGVGWLTTPWRPVLPWWSIVVANTLASFLAGVYLLRKHRGLWRRLMPLAS